MSGASPKLSQHRKSHPPVCSYLSRAPLSVPQSPSQTVLWSVECCSHVPIFQKRHRTQSELPGLLTRCSVLEMVLFHCPSFALTQGGRWDGRKSRGLGVRRRGLWSRLCQLQMVWPWLSHLATWGLIFLPWKHGPGQAWCFLICSGDLWTRLAWPGCLADVHLGLEEEPPGTVRSFPPVLRGSPGAVSSCWGKQTHGSNIAHFIWRSGNVF